MAETALSKEIIKLLKEAGFSQVYLRNCGDNFYSFSKALADAVDYNEFGPFVDKQSPGELHQRGAVAFLSRDKRAGVAVWPDGNIRAVFKDSRSKNNGAIGELMLTALQAGGKKLDCFDGFLSGAYAQFGFIPVCRIKFSKDFAPENWKTKFGNPDIIFWRHCGDDVQTVAKNLTTYKLYTKKELHQLPCFDSYDEACKYRDEKMGMSQN